MSKTKLFLQCIMLCALAAAAGCSSSNSNGYYGNDGPPGLFQTKLITWGDDEIELKIEEPNKWANRPYTVLGKRYYPVTGDQPMTQVGTASWYGKQFHGKKTSIGEIYDMHAMTAAHPTMELPSYAKVTNLENGRSIIVRVNDRGPFLHGRIIDLSYAGAVKLGYVKQGTAKVRVERITRRDIAAGRIPSATSTSAVVAENKTVRTASAAPVQRQSTTTSQAASPAPVQTVYAAPQRSSVPSAAPAQTASAPQPTPRTVVPSTAAAASTAYAAPATAAPARQDVMRTTLEDQQYANQVSVTLSIPVENAENAASSDAMGAIAAAQPAPTPSAVQTPPASTELWAVQIGAYGVQENARQAAAHAEMMLSTVANATVRVVDTGKVWKVLSGSFATKDEASQFARTVSDRLGSPAFAVAQ